MTTNDIKLKINSSEYDFLRNDKLLGKNIIMLTLGGSHAYGTSNKNSDLDVRGITLNQRSDLIGLSSFEQFINNETDTTIFSFNKVISLISNCNPNTIEILGCKPEHYFILSDIGKSLLDNKKLFLSQRASYSFGGYANQQLMRLKNAIARDRVSDNEKEKHILNNLKNNMLSFSDRYTEFDNGSINLFIDNSNKTDFGEEIYMDVNLKKYPLRDYLGICSEMNNIMKDFNKLNKRNNKKDEQHLNKHAMHLIRLYLMCLDILEKEEINTYRENDIELLMEIRNGKYMNEDGSYQSEFFEIINGYEQKLEYAKNNTSLPKNPNYKHIEEFVMSVNERVINNEF
ncbi:MAG TPA: nucleotidyltransferase domain-containing protein [Candidatus Paceibacterota bacterium]